jgi:LiaI-LiaF-like transmembrane region
MVDQVKCCCTRCRTRGVMGPVVLITLGVLFLIGQYSGRYSFGQLWPVLLIVIGAVKIFQSTVSTEGHIAPR